MNDFSFRCPFCKQSIEAPLDMVGQLVDCPSCGKAIEVARNTPDWKRSHGRMQTAETSSGHQTFMASLRWILFIPAAIIGGIATAFLFVVGSFIFPAVIRHVCSGIGAAGGTVIIGLAVAPKKNQTVKWVLIVLVVVFGALDALGSIAVGSNREKAVIGISMIVGALMFSTLDPAEINKSKRNATERPRQDV